MRKPEHGALPLPSGERVGVRGRMTLDRLVPPHPDRFAIRPLRVGERWSKPRCLRINFSIGGDASAMKGNVGTARRLRRDQTDAERVLWFRLRDRRLEGWKFRRQAPIDRFVVDFVCADARVIVELDGGQHVERSEQDRARTEILQSAGYLVLRFWNNDLLANTDGVVETILAALNQSKSVPPHPDPLPAGEREKRA